MNTTVRAKSITIGLLVLIVIAKQSLANEPYLDQNRQAYIASVLQAFGETSMLDISNTYEYISVAERNHCRSSLSDLRTDCLLSYARKNCATADNAESLSSCELYSDVIVVNKLSTKSFINRTERYRMLTNKKSDFREAMTNRLQQKYARIVTQFSMTDAADCRDTDFNCLSRGLDQFCLDYANTQSLSWQHCIGASLWFIGTAKQN